MRFLLDANCWMEVVRSRPSEQDVRQFLSTVPPADIMVTDFAVHSIGVAMKRHKVLNAYPAFIQKTGIGDTIQIVRLQMLHMPQVVAACDMHRLDFDDAYQYVAAELHHLDLVSLDSDFDHTPRGRLTPAAALQRFTDEQRKQTP